MAQLNIQDNSGDKDFFTILPNYIANHSTANDQSLYFQMKRYAGEDGQCFATEETLMRKMGIGQKAYNKSLKYLIEKEWITFIGTTRGKTRPIKTYKINNIWKLNNQEYQKIPAESTVSSEKIPAESIKDTFQKHSKIPAESTVEEEPKIRKINNNTLLKTIKGKTPNEDINYLIEKMKEIFNLPVLDGIVSDNRRFCWLALKKFKGREMVEGIMLTAAQDKFWSTKITDFKTLYYNGVKIVSSLKKHRRNIIGLN